ncbi:thymidylate synthase [Sphaerisporangium krabiense]|uniref:Thymidylate synthase n=1 Tax=Sphaerisporangium krabiense TaxID=763782 RepID=A0A7W8ZD11_9ACTN|nr:thymidylate synthase [Sphaerisporangium krabiense]MBB5631756.1 thymidylate synthase [Sphaerisporangium krabiense]GII60608.1 thymidylate synthase [Sphaerisporangium krabiense]
MNASAGRVAAPAFATFHDAYLAVLEEVVSRPQHAAASRGNTATEVLGMSFTLTDPRHRIPYLQARRVNIVFNHAEVLWYLAGRDDVAMIGYYAPRLRRLASGGRLTGTAYGPRLFHPAGASQWDRAVDLLRGDPGSKRAVALIMQPGELADPGNPDVACTLGLQFFLREGALHTVAFMRGNDAWIGLACDVFSFTMIAEYTAVVLGARLGTYTHMVSSMHLNTPDQAKARAALVQAHPGLCSAAGAAPVMPATTTRDTLDVVLDWEQCLRADQRPLPVHSSELAHLDPYWLQVLGLLEAYRQIVHHSGPVTGEVMDLLTPPYRWLLAVRWPDRVLPPPASCATPGLERSVLGPWDAS